MINLFFGILFVVVGISMSNAGISHPAAFMFAGYVLGVICMCAHQHLEDLKQ